MARKTILAACAAAVLAAIVVPANALYSDVHVVVGSTRSDAGDRFDVFFVDTPLAGSGKAVLRRFGTTAVTIDITCTAIFFYPYFPPQITHRAFASGLGSDSQTYHIMISDSTAGINFDNWLVTTVPGAGPCGTPVTNYSMVQAPASWDFSVLP